MTFYFYDLETTGISGRSDRIMQFGGQRTDKNLKLIGQPDNFLIKITPDVLPDPGAILITGITPQQTLQDGITEAEFLKYFSQNISIPDTIFIGFNNIRFDDEFMRFMLWRNFYDAYEWQWKDGSSRWDLLDLVRLTRALRPEGIEWPKTADGKPTNRLELLSNANQLNHSSAHDALSDVIAAIEVARLIKSKQPKLFDYLLNLRSKDKAAALVNGGQPFVYASGRYPGKYLNTSVVAKIADHPQRPGALVYDLREDPDEFINLSSDELAQRWSARGKDVPYFPVKALYYNKSPAIAPLTVLDTESSKRLKINRKVLNDNLNKLNTSDDFSDKLVRALDISQPKIQPDVDPIKVDELLYAGFISSEDKTKASVIRAANAEKITELNLDFNDERLNFLLPLYKARNFPKYLTADEQQKWEEFRRQKLLGEEPSALSIYYKKLNDAITRNDITDEQKYLLEELNLYGQSIAPVDQ